MFRRVVPAFTKSGARAFVPNAKFQIRKKYITLQDLCDRTWNGDARSIASSLVTTDPIRAVRSDLDVIASRSSRFPLSGTFEHDGAVFQPALLPLLEHFLSPERVQGLRTVAAKRMFSLLPIIEGLVDYDNIGAVMRSAEGFGIGGVWAIGGNKVRALSTSRCSAGAEKWVDTQVFLSTPQCLTAAKRAGYRVAVAALGPKAIPIDQVDWADTPTAIVLGNEAKGVTSEAQELADIQVMIPMGGLVESFNVSVAGACIMQTAMAQIRKRPDRWLTEQEIEVLLTAMALRQDVLVGDMVCELLQRRKKGEAENSIKGFFEAHG